MKCGIIYARLFPKEENLGWVRFCHIYDAFPDPLMNVIKEVVTYINNKYKDDIIIPMGLDAQIGCVVKPEKADSIATSIFNIYSGLLSSISVQPCVRLVYTIGELDMIDVDSIHKLYPELNVVRVGRYLDSSDETDIYKI